MTHARNSYMSLSTWYLKLVRHLPGFPSGDLQGFPVEFLCRPGFSSGNLGRDKRDRVSGVFRIFRIGDTPLGWSLDVRGEQAFVGVRDFNLLVLVLGGVDL